jgi:MGT family glycosyltransferase
MVAILLVSTPVHGHVTPLLAVARFLVGRGHRVRFLTGSRFRGAVERTGAAFLPLPPEADYDVSEADSRFPGKRGLTGLAALRFDIAEIFLRPVPAQLAALDAAMAAEPVDAVLVETMFFGATALLTRPRARRPAVISLGIVPMTLASVDTAPFGLGIPPMGGPLGRARNAVLGLVARHAVFGSVQREARRLVAEATGARLETFFMDAAALADAVVQFSVPGFEYPRSDLPDRVHFVGPVSRSATSDAPLPEWWGDLDGSRAVVHVTQGTVANADYAELIAPAIAGLADDDVLVVVSTGGRPVSALGALPANVRAAEYLPYDALLPLTDVYVSNGGYGGVHAAMRHGVPLVVAGQTEDKVEVTARVAWSGVGINLRTNRPTADALRDAVRTVLTAPRYRDASASVGAEIASSSGLPGLEAVVVAAAAVSE